MRRTLGWIFGTAGLLLFAAAVDVLLLHPKQAPVPEQIAATSSSDASAPQLPNVAAVAAAHRDPYIHEVAAPVPHGPEHPVDLERIRALIPENSYWTRHAPTDDPVELERRRLDERSWNTLFGKVQAGEATLDEIDAWFEHRRRTSEDAIAFARQVLETYGDALPERERGLYELAIRMHTTRLEELPRDRQEALDRMRVQAERRKSWSDEQR